MQPIDCRGLACPQPVLRTKQALEEISTGSIIVIVDNEAAKGNVTRFAESQGCKVSVEEKEGVFYLAIEKKEESKTTGTMPPNFLTCQPGQQKMPSKKETAFVFKSDQMGAGDAALGKILVQALLKTLSSVDEKPNKLIFYNRGVYLAIEGSEVLPILKDLAANGMEILVCGTCLDYYHLKEKLAVGTISNMFSILETMAKADKVIFP
ncbi:MAG: sulfurtransferase-like selenium metabolism protein YedF [Thermodesulfobacteriota bacterium]|nr:sulfurtransferase-like selenium metabolism protein YedF [Thermodesulfobacteriota bacterium]